MQSPPRLCHHDPRCVHDSKSLKHTGGSWGLLVWNRDVPCKPCRGKTQSCPRECAIDNTAINLGANAILPQLQRPKPGSIDPVAPYKLCQLVDLLHCQNPCLAVPVQPELARLFDPG